MIGAVMEFSPACYWLAFARHRALCIANCPRNASPNIGGNAPGGVLGVALLGSMVRARAAFLSGLHVGLAIAAGAFFAAALITFGAVNHTD
jgi:hypothetical protein